MIRHLPIGGGFLLASALLHVAVLASAYTYFATSFDVEPVEEVSERISLGLVASQAGSVAQPVTEPVREEAEPEKPKPVTSKVVDAPAPKQVREPEKTPPPERKDPPPEDVEAEETPPAPPPSQTAVEGHQGLEGTQTTPIQQVETSSNAEAGARQAEARYDLLVLRVLKKEKRYPALAKRRRHEGTVRLRFTIDRAGTLVCPEEMRADSRWPELNQSVLQQLARAAPFPAAPEEVRWQTRTYNVDVNFSLEDEAL